ncbi:MAG: hypothetical protein RL217_860 [Pseudomonadota bacterium]
MTRAKKTRSLKRIHDVRTGSKSKLKKQLGTDRQVGKRVKGRRIPSTYEKFLAENPAAKEQERLEQLAAQLSIEQTSTSAAKDTPKTKAEDKPERSKSLLDQLDGNLTKDIY